MKKFYHLVFSLFVVSILALCGCSADTTSGTASQPEQSTSSDMGFIISFGSLSRASYYTIDEVSYFKVQVSLDSTVVKEKTATFSDTVKIALTKEGLYTITIAAYNSDNTQIADGSAQKWLYHDSGYQRVSISITPYSKTIDVIVDVSWVQPEDTDDCYEAVFMMNDGNSEVFYSKSISSSSESYEACGHYSFFTDEIPVPTRLGYLFNGWCSDEGCSNVVRTYTIFTDDIKHGYYMSANTTFYAKWVEVPNLIWSGSEFLRTKKTFDSSYFYSFNDYGTFTVYFHNDSPDPKYDSISLYAGGTRIYTKNLHINGSGYDSFSFILSEENLELLKTYGLTVSSSSYYDFYLRGLAFAEGETCQEADAPSYTYKEAAISASGVYTVTLPKEGFGNGWGGNDSQKQFKIVIAPRDVVAKMITGEITDERELFIDENKCYVYANNSVGNAKITTSDLSVDTYLQPAGTSGIEYTGLAVRMDENGNYVVLFDITKMNKDILLARSNIESNEDVWENKDNIESDYVPMILGSITASDFYPFEMWNAGVAILEPTEEAYPEIINKESVPMANDVKYIYGNLTDWSNVELTNGTYEFTYFANRYDDYLSFNFYSKDSTLRMGGAYFASLDENVELARGSGDVMLPTSLLTEGTTYVITFTVTSDYTATACICAK